MMDERLRFVAKLLDGEAMTDVWLVATQEIDETNAAIKPAPPIDIASRVRASLGDKRKAPWSAANWNHAAADFVFQMKALALADVYPADSTGGRNRLVKSFSGCFVI